MDKVIKINSCNNIIDVEIPLNDGQVTVLFGPNGSGKSTIAAAIAAQCQDNNDALNDLTPYTANRCPSVEGISKGTIACFNESYINDMLYQDDTHLLKDGYHIFIETEQYRWARKQTENLFEQTQNELNQNGDINALLEIINRLLNCYGKATKGYAKSSQLGKTVMGKGDLIANVPKQFTPYKQLIKSDKAIPWISWHKKGEEFSSFGICPYCGQPFTNDMKAICSELQNTYGNKYIDNFDSVIEAFNNAEDCLSDETIARMDRLLHRSINEDISEEDESLLSDIRGEAEFLKQRLIQLQYFNYNTFWKVEDVEDFLKQQLIDPNKILKMGSSYVLEKIANINLILENLIADITNINKILRIQASELRKSLNSSMDDINDFFRNAGFPYEFSVAIEDGSSCTVVLKPIGIDMQVLQPEKRLSYGERNALAVALFAAQVKRDKPELVLIDDPISSFDQNKKYAIIQRLFSKRFGICQNTTTLLLTHDIETLIMLARVHKDRLCSMEFFFVCNKKGHIDLLPIEEDNINSAIQMLKWGIAEDMPLPCRLVRARQLVELTKEDSSAWQLLSSALHRRARPSRIDGTPLNDGVINKGIAILSDIGFVDFDYSYIQNQLTNEVLLNQYNMASSPYEKLCIFRIVADDCRQIKNNGDSGMSDVVFEFASEFFHVENLFLYQLDPDKYDQIPAYIIETCDELIDKYKNQLLYL